MRQAKAQAVVLLKTLCRDELDERAENLPTQKNTNDFLAKLDVKGRRHFLVHDDIIRMKTLLMDAGWTVGRVATTLNVSRQCVAYWINQSFEEKKRRGRPPLIPNAVYDQLLRNNATLSIRQVRDKIEKIGLTRNRSGAPSISTLRRYCTHLNYSSKIIKVRHKLTPDQKEKRMEFASEWLSKPPSRNIWFVDESSIFISFNQGRAWVKRGEPLPDIRTERTRNLYLRWWAGISCDGRTKLIFHTGKYNSDAYASVIINELVPVATKIHGSTWTLYQDNDSTHTSKKAVQQYGQFIPHFSNPPAWSPDFNPIELL